MLSSREIAEAKIRMKYSYKSEVLHEHEDCIRIAYEWLDAQATTKGVTRFARPLKHIIEKWGGRYVSQSDVEVAAELHPAIRGTYPYFNISRRLVRPSDARLTNIREARTQNYKLTPRAAAETYTTSES
jgi:hypothetical protein